MTQYNEAVEKQKELLEIEKKAKLIKSIETRFKDGLWYQQTIDYQDGRRVIEFRDSRKKTIEEYIYGEDVE